MTRSPAVMILLYALTLLNPCTVGDVGQAQGAVGDREEPSRNPAAEMNHIRTGLADGAAQQGRAAQRGQRVFGPHVERHMPRSPSRSTCSASLPPGEITVLTWPRRTSSRLSFSTAPRSTPPSSSAGRIWRNVHAGMIMRLSSRFNVEHAAQGFARRRREIVSRLGGLRKRRIVRVPVRAADGRTRACRQSGRASRRACAAWR